jgi:ATP-dependent exoDNAse (exonuclease V) beta subunit
MRTPLNEGQERAAATLQGPVLISAGAGTGKTRVLTERFVRAVVPGSVEGWAPAGVDELLTITFTEKAAGELVERIRTSLRSAGLRREARELDGAWISTIHGFCARVLRRHALEAGLDPGFAVADETEAREIREQAFEQAAHSLHGSSECVRGLFALYGFQPVWAAVERIARSLDTHGLTADSIAVEPSPDVDRLLAETLELFGEAHGLLEPHACDSKGAANHTDACRTLLDALEDLDATVMGSAERAERIWRALDGYSARGGSAASVRDICEEVKATRNRLLAEAVAVITAPATSALVALTASYTHTLAALKKARGVLDFGDLQMHAAHLLERRPDLRGRYRSAFRLLMVDEFQDTDELQLRVIQSVAGENLCTVGDERQSIYRFRGADLDVYRRHREEMSRAGAHPVELVENYRSHADVIGFVNTVFSHPRLFGGDLLHLEARRTEPQSPLVTARTPRICADLVHAGGSPKAASRQAEAESLADRFSLLRDAGVSPADMVVLVRRYASADPMANALRSRGFPVLVVGGRRFLDLPEVTMMRSLCRVIANPRDDRALAAVLLSSMSAVSDDGLWLLRNAERSREAGEHLWDGLSVAEHTLSAADAGAAVALLDVIERARDRGGALPLAEVLARALEESGADLALLACDDQGPQALANVGRFIRKADEFERSGGSGPAAFVTRLDVEERFGYQETPSAVSDDGSPAVRIMSVHASKGLEFPVVALPFLGDSAPADTGVLRTRVCDGRLEMALALPASYGGSSESRRSHLFEQMRSLEAAAQAEESKRLLYVACTRAREILLLSGSANLEKGPADGAGCPLGLMREALDSLLEGAPGTDEVRLLPEGTRVSLRVHETPAEPDVTSATANAASLAGEPLAQTPRADDSAEVLRVAGGVAPTRPDRISYSDISVFESCSLKYWAQRVARLGSVSATSGDDPLRFGSALHAVLQLGTAGAAVPSPARVAAIGRFHRLGSGELSRLTEASERFAASRAALRLESCDTVRREYPFSVRMTSGGHVVELAGAMDAYGRTGSDALILDYKSGTSTADEGELRARFDTQARCYAYVALSEGSERVTVVFVRPEVACGDGGVQEVTFEFTAADGAVIEAALIDAYEAIATTNYHPLAEWDEHVCRSCRIAGTLCPLIPPGRVAG